MINRYFIFILMGFCALSMPFISPSSLLRFPLFSLFVCFSPPPLSLSISFCLSVDFSLFLALPYVRSLTLPFSPILLSLFLAACLLSCSICFFLFLLLSSLLSLSLAQFRSHSLFVLALILSPPPCVSSFCPFSPLFPFPRTFPFHKTPKNDYTPSTVVNDRQKNRPTNHKQHKCENFTISSWAML